jgi:hypothetical protein
MPTTNHEAGKIIELCSKYGVEPKNLLGLCEDLYEQVGLVSNNWSVRETMRMLYERAIDIALKARPADMQPEDFLLIIGVRRPGDSEAAIAKSWSARSPWLMLFYVIVVSHVVVWVTLLTSCVLTFMHQPWYLAMLAFSFSFYLLTTHTMCPITRWENQVRRKLVWPEINHFTYWYVICPIFHGRTCGHKCSPVRAGPD